MGHIDIVQLMINKAKYYFDKRDLSTITLWNMPYSYFVDNKDWNMGMSYACGRRNFNIIDFFINKGATRCSCRWEKESGNPHHIHQK